MPKDDTRALKLLKGGAVTTETATTETATRSVRRRAATRRTPRQRDPLAEILEHLDEEPVEDFVEKAEPTEKTEPVEKAEPTGNKRRVRLVRPQWTTLALLAVLCAALVAAAVLGGQWYGDRQLDAAHQQALAAAKQTTVNFVSVSAASVDRDLQRIVAGSAGQFKDEFSRGQAQVRAAIVENNVDSRGTVLRAALVSGDRRSAVVLVAVDATVKNTKTPDGRASHYRIQVDMTRDASGRWLVSRLQFVG
jgi:Mce-associated membrane protein